MLQANSVYIDQYLKIGTAQTNTAFANREAAIAAIADTEKTIAKETPIVKIGLF